jgi:predicted DNA-binding transcriptional regulator AlpA
MLATRVGRQLYTDRMVMDRLGLSRSAFYRYLQRGVITQPVGKVAKNRRGWTEQDIEVAKLELWQGKEAAQ